MGKKDLILKLTAVVLTHNDEQVVKRCLEALSFADQIVVVDDNSTDRTVSVAKLSGVKDIFERPLNGDFSAQRNFALEKAEGDWVLFIDSDEVVPDGLAKEIREAINQADWSGFFLKRRDFLFGRYLKHGETAKVKLLRLGKRDAGLFHRPVHEVWQLTGKIGELSNPLEHYPHQSVSEFVSEVNHYSTLNAGYLYARGVKINCLGIIAYPLAKFIQNYVFRAGFKDGVPGLILAALMSFHSFLVRGKLYFLHLRHAQ